jgi:hypothetical protein
MSKKNNQTDWAFGPISLTPEELKPHLLISNISSAEMVKLIKEMSIKFTKKREDIHDYVFEHRHVSAYASFYLPTNMPKLEFLLSQLPSDVIQDFKNRPFIDIGAGPGTFSLAWKKLLKISSHVEMIAVDTSKIMLDQAEKIMNGFFPKHKFLSTTKFAEKKENSVLFFGHSINEMGREKAQDYIMTIDPEYIIWIEPGTSELFKELVILRDIVLDHYDVLYPCPSSAACPNTWCHQVLRTTHLPELERLSQLVELDRKILPMTAHVYRRKSKTPTVATQATVIRYIQETKFSFEYEVCYAFEGTNINAIIEIQKKLLTKEEVKNFKHSSVGDRLDFTVLKVIGEKLRVKLN